MSRSDAFGGRFHCSKFHGKCFCVCTDGLTELLVTECHHWLLQKGGGEQSFKLQERGTALKNKGDRCQYINFMRMKKKNQLIKIDYCCFVNVFLN